MYNEYVVTNRWVFDPARGLKITCKTPQVPDSALRTKPGQFVKVARSRIQDESDSDEDEYGSNENTHAAEISKKAKIVSAPKRKGKQKTVSKAQPKATQSKPTRPPPPKVSKTPKVISLSKPPTKGNSKKSKSMPSAKELPSAKEPLKQVLNNKIYLNYYLCVLYI